MFDLHLCVPMKDKGRKLNFTSLHHQANFHLQIPNAQVSNHAPSKLKPRSPLTQLFVSVSLITPQLQDGTRQSVMHPWITTLKHRVDNKGPKNKDQRYKTHPV